MIKALAAGVISRLVTSLLTERFVINVAILLLEWLVKRTENDLDDRLLEHLKDALDNDHGTPLNLYDEIKRKY